MAIFQARGARNPIRSHQSECDYDDPGELWTARRLAARYAVGVQFIYAHADELGVIRLGAGPSPRLRFDPAVVRERWASVNALPPVAP